MLFNNYSLVTLTRPSGRIVRQNAAQETHGIKEQHSTQSKMSQSILLSKCTNFSPFIDNYTLHDSKALAINCGNSDDFYYNRKEKKCRSRDIQLFDIQQVSNVFDIDFEMNAPKKIRKSHQRKKNSATIKKSKTKISIVNLGIDMSA
ncbi:hypothetical protein BpHYR1_045536 [Brachionus plicatilis]|uniref:Uncharacterized protein n=1 Tax=Brachionus plicatilis TaxID=10195 RepID=A0A3M7SCT9_BRAPC|nr:hypothetical protein BpHYR1_045536 [Brachionus plicatilis]